MLGWEAGAGTCNRQTMWAAPEVVVAAGEFELDAELMAETGEDELGLGLGEEEEEPVTGLAVAGLDCARLRGSWSGGAAEETKVASQGSFSPPRGLRIVNSRAIPVSGTCWPCFERKKGQGP